MPPDDEQLPRPPKPPRFGGSAPQRKPAPKVDESEWYLNDPWLLEQALTRICARTRRFLSRGAPSAVVEGILRLPEVLPVLNAAAQILAQEAQDVVDYEFDQAMGNNNESGDDDEQE